MEMYQIFFLALDVGVGITGDLYFFPCVFVTLPREVTFIFVGGGR